MLNNSNLRDVYRCPNCHTYVAHGDRFCKGCGKEFTDEDVSKMRKVGGVRFVILVLFAIVAMVLLVVFFDLTI